MLSLGLRLAWSQVYAIRDGWRGSGCPPDPCRWHRGH